MTDQAEPGLVEQMVESLREGGEAETAEPGTFSLDVESADRKLRELRLPNPHHWVLLAVRGMVRAGAKRMSSDERGDSLELHGDVALELPAEAGGCVNAAAGSGGNGLRQLVLAAYVGVRAGLRRVTIRAGTRRFVVQPDRVHLEEGEAIEGVLIVAEGQLSPDLDGQRVEQWVLRKRCRYLDARLTVGQDQVSAHRMMDIDLDSETLGFHGESDPEIEVRFGCVPLEEGEVRLLVDGVWVDTVPRKRWHSGLVAVVRGDFELDAGESKVVQNDLYRRALAKAELDRPLERPSPSGRERRSGHRKSARQAVGTMDWEFVLGVAFVLPAASFFVRMEEDMVTNLGLCALIAVAAVPGWFLLIRRLENALRIGDARTELLQSVPPHHPARSVVTDILGETQPWPYGVAVATMVAAVLAVAAYLMHTGDVLPDQPWPQLALSYPPWILGSVLAFLFRERRPIDEEPPL